MNSSVNSFSVPEYQGVWLSFQNDRFELRGRIETCLRELLGDAEGKLIVDDRGPHWQGSVHLKGLSYSHTSDVALLCFSKTHELGVDVESLHREFLQEPTKLAERFFHENEAKKLKTRNEILTRWIQKEAYAKLTREGLKETIRVDLSQWIDDLSQPAFKKIPKFPAGYEAWIAFREHC
jgi:phosphopantetheinyl transferase (holo-ACP synthase)